ncbi:MFS transporter [Streptomyces fuscichromogenes]|uniref:MFS transporter n=1 Tax=Streptomyces fuscichromogenes TaxID=1324013 RepID=UPI003828C286
MTTTQTSPGKSRLVRRLRAAALDPRPLAVPAFRRLLLAQAAAYVGTVVTEVAVSVQVYALSHSSFLVGLTGLAGLLPIVVFGLYGGAVADRVDRRLLYLGASAAAWLLTLALLAQAVVGLRSVAVVMVLSAGQAGAFALSSSARGAIIPRVVAVGMIPAANTLMFTVGTAGQVGGPLLAGVLLTLPGGFCWAYAADALLFTSLLYSAYRLPSVRPAAGHPVRGGWRPVWEGLRFIGGRPVLWMSFAVDIAAMVLAMPTALFPQVAADRFHGGVGPLYSAIAVGSLAAGLLSGWIARVRRQGVALAAAVATWAAAVGLAGTARSLWAAVALLACAGAADLVSAVYRETILQTYAPDALRGRLQGVFTVVVAGGPRLGDLRAGAMAVTTGLGAAWSGSAFLCLALVVTATALVRPFRRYEPAAVPPETVPDAP